MTQKELNKEKKEISAEKEHYYSVIKYFEACTDKCKDKNWNSFTCISSVQNFLNSLSGQVFGKREWGKV